MLLHTLLALAPAAFLQEQELPVLVPEEPVEGVVTKEDALFESDASRAAYPCAPGFHGDRFELRFEAAGSHAVVLESLDFDPYLIVRGADGTLRGENDDDGQVLDSRVVVEVDAGESLVVLACSANSWGGRYTLRCYPVTAAASREDEDVTARRNMEARFERASARLDEAIEVHGGHSMEAAVASLGLAWLQGVAVGASQGLERCNSTLPVIEDLVGPNAREVIDLLRVREELHLALHDYASAMEDLERRMGLYRLHFDDAQACTVGLVYRLGATLVAQGSFHEAVVVLERAQKDCEGALPRDSSLEMTILDSLARAYSGAARVSDMRSVRERILESRRRVHADAHFAVASAENNLGSALYSQGEFEEALAHHLEALRVLDQLETDWPALRAIYWHNIAECRLSLMDRAGALEAFSKKVDGWRPYLATHAEAGSSLHETAERLHNLSEYEEARPVYELAAESLEATLGPDSQEARATIDRLVHLYRVHLKQLEPVLALREEQLREALVQGRSPWEMIEPRAQVAAAMEELGHWQEADAVIEELAGLGEGLKGIRMRRVARELSRVGAALAADDYKRVPRNLLEAAVEMHVADRGEHHDDVAKALNQLASVMIESTEGGTRSLHRRTLVVAERALACNEDVHGPESLQAAHSNWYLARALGLSGRHSESRECAERALKLRERHLGPAHWDTLDARLMLASCVAADGDVPAALRVLDEARKIAEENGVSYDLQDKRIDLARALHHKLKYAESFEVWKGVLQTVRQRAGHDSAEAIEVEWELSWSLHYMGEYRESLPHWERVLAHRRETYGEVHQETAKACHALAIALLKLGEYSRAEVLLRDYLSACTQLYGTDGIFTGKALGDLSVVLWRQGRLFESRDLQERATEIYRRRGEPLGIAHGNLGMLNLELGHIEKAAGLLEQAYELRLEELGPDASSLAWNLSALAYARQMEGNIELSVELYRRSVSHASKTLGADHPQTARYMRQYAEALIVAGEYAEAVSTLEQALAVVEEKIGPESERAGLVLSAMGDALQKMGRDEEGRAISARAVTILEQTLGPDHFRTARAIRQQPLALGEEGAIPRLERAVAAQEEALGQDTPEVAASLFGLARLLQGDGRLISALRNCERSLEIRRRIYGEGHPLTAESLHLLGAIEMEAGETASARQHLEAAFGALQKARGPNHPSTADCAATLSEFVESQGDLPEAVELMQQVIVARVQKLGEQHVQTVEARERLAGLLVEAERFQESEVLYRAVLRERERALPDDHELLQETRSRLASVLRELGEAAAAATIEGDIREGRSYPPILTVLVPESTEAVIDSRELELDAVVTDYTGVQDVRIDHEGEVISAAVRPGMLEIDESGLRGRLRFPLRIGAGKDSTEAVLRAVNRLGLQSDPEEVVVRYEPARRSLYVLAIGVADYEDDALDLAYPVKDVDDLIERLSKEAGGLYSQVHVERLVDREVTVAAVHRLRHEFLRRAEPQDTILVFVAGHGVRAEDEYYFLTPPCTAAAPYGGINREALESLVTWDKLHARRRVLLIDSCHSGESLETRTRADQRGVGVLSQERVDEAVALAAGGLYIMAATSEQGLAREASGNGLFTRALLEGMSGAADSDGNGLVEIEELKEFAATQVHRSTGGKQRPTLPAVRGGENFPLVKGRR